MSLFDVYLAVDWSAKSSPTPPKPSPDAVWVGERMAEEESNCEFYAQTRTDCEDFLRTRLLAYRDAGKRVFLGFDFPYGYPAGYAAAIGLQGREPAWRATWNELKNLIEDDDDNVNNRFAVAAALNARCKGESEGPFWGCHQGIQEACLKSTGTSYPYLTRSGIVLNEKRETERRLSGVQPTWKLWGNGTVGSQALVGIPVVARLRDDPELKGVSRVWPFETGFGLDPVAPGKPFVLHAEIWPGVVNAMLDHRISIKDQRQVRAMVDWLAVLDATNTLPPLFGRPAGLSDDGMKQAIEEEGWIFGAGR
jgi:hypothetical protein